MPKKNKRNQYCLKFWEKNKKHSTTLILFSKLPAKDTQKKLKTLGNFKEIISRRMENDTQYNHENW